MHFAKQSKGKKNIAVLLVVAMLLTIMPVAAFAVDGTDATVTAAMYDGEGNVTDKVTAKLGEQFQLTAKLTTPSQLTTVYVTWTPTGEGDTTITETCDDMGYTYTSSNTFTMAEDLAEVTAIFTDGENAIATAKATIEVAGNVAKIGDTEYETLDEAVNAAASGDTIKLLANCTTNGWDLSKSLTIEGTGNQTVTFDKKGIALWKGILTFKDCDIVMNDIGSTPYAEWSWMAFGMTGDADFNLVNANMTMDAAKGNVAAAFYMCATGNDITLTDSTLTIRGYKENAFAVDTPVAHGYKLTMVRSKLTSDNNRACFAAGDRWGKFGCMDVSLTESTLEAMNNTDDGCSGVQNFYLDNSKVTFTDNRSRGIRAYDMKIKNNSVVTVSGKHSNWGLSIGPLSSKGGSLEMDGTSKLYLTSNTGTGLSNRGSSHISKGAIISITGNGNCGIKNYNELKIDEGVNVTISQNSTSSNGGGIYNNGAMVLPTDANLYNNHAKSAGDDIYNYNYSNSDAIYIQFNDVKVEDGFALDGVNGTVEHCTDTIDGWYDDSRVVKDKPETGRWEAHAGDTNHIVQYTDFTDDRVTLVGTKALKAAHGLTDLTIQKVDEKGELIKTDETTFILKNTEGNYYQKNNNGLFNWGTKVNATGLVTSGSMIKITNLVPGKYYIEEVKAPTGYELKTDAVEVTLVKGEDNLVKFENKKQTGAIDGYVFNDVEVEKQRDNIYVVADDKELADVKVTLYKMQADGKKYDPAGETKTDANGYYKFDNLIPGAEYFVYVERPTAYNRNCDYAYTDSQKDGDRFKTYAVVTGENGNALYCSDIITVVANETARANAGFYYVSSSGPVDPWTPVEPPTKPDPVDPPEEEIPDPDVPLVEPEEPTTEIDEPDVPLVEPGTPVEEIDEPEVPLGDAPKTGDAAPIVGLIGLLIVAVAGLVVVRRKFN